MKGKKWGLLLTTFQKTGAWNQNFENNNFLPCICRFRNMEAEWVSLNVGLAYWSQKWLDSAKIQYWKMLTDVSGLNDCGNTDCHSKFGIKRKLTTRGNQSSGVWEAFKKIRFQSPEDRSHSQYGCQGYTCNTFMVGIDTKNPQHGGHFVSLSCEWKKPTATFTLVTLPPLKSARVKSISSSYPSGLKKSYFAMFKPSDAKAHLGTSKTLLPPLLFFLFCLKIPARLHQCFQPNSNFSTVLLYFSFCLSVSRPQLLFLGFWWSSWAVIFLITSCRFFCCPTVCLSLEKCPVTQTAHCSYTYLFQLIIRH